MTDDDLDRALFNLSLEEPPADLHERILSATVRRAVAPVAFRPWELWLLAAAVVLVAFITVALLASVPDLVDRVPFTFVGAMHALGLFSLSTYVWCAVGASAVYGISSLPLMPGNRRAVYNR
jgi:hypothetical protein